MGSKSGIDGVLDVAVVSGAVSGGGDAAVGTTGSATPSSADYIGFGVSGNLVGVSAASPLPVTGAVVDSTNYTTPDSRAVKVVSNAAILFSDDFGGAALNANAALWDVLDGGLGANPSLDGGSLIQSAIGSGVYMGNGVNGPTNSALSVSASALSIAMGTTNGAELWLLSKQAFAGTEDLFFTFLKSQALAANSIAVGLVEVDPATLIPLYNANTPGFTVNGQTIPSAFTNAGVVELGCQTVNTSYVACAIGDRSPTGAVGAAGTTLAAMTGASEFLVEFHAEDVIASNGATDSAAAKAPNISRVSSQTPDDGKVYKLLVRLRNVATPANSTTVTFGRIMLWNSQEMRVEVASGRGDFNGQKAVAVNLVNALPGGSNTIGFVYGRATNALGGVSTARITSNAAQAYGSIKTSSGQLYGYELYNTQASVRYVHFYNKASQPTLGTDTPLFTVALPPTSRVALSSDICLGVFSTGIEYQITTDDGTIPTTTGAAGDVVGTAMYA